MGIELLNPKGLWLLTAIVPLVILYILKIKRERLRIPSTWLWAAARRDLLAKHPFKKLVPELPLFLQLLALIGLSLALARPALRGGRLTGDHIAIVIDTSASMGTTAKTSDGKKTTRMALAIEAARNAIDNMEPGADVIIIEGAREAKVVSPLDRDARRLKATLAQVSVREVEGDLTAAVSLAADRVRSLGGKRRVLLITDGALASETPLATAGVDMQVVTVGEPADNLGIIRIDVRAGVDPVTRHDQVQAFGMLKNYGSKPRDAYVTVTVEGKKEPAASRRVLVQPNEKEAVVLSFEPGPLEFGKGLVMQVSAGDALPIDDVAYGRVPQSRKMPVAHAATGYSWIARALEADPDIDVQQLTPAQLGTVNVDPDALVVVEGACPDNPPGLDVLVINPPPGTCMGVDVGAQIEQPQITSWEQGDARLRFLTFDGVHIAKANPVKTPGQAGLLRAGLISLIADASSPGKTATIIGFDVGESDWPLKASFVLFIRNVVEMARLHRSQGTTGPARTGDALRVAVPKDVSKVIAEGPGMPEHDVAAKGGFTIIPAVDRAGIYRVRWTEPRYGNAVIVANLTSERESDIRSRPVVVDQNGGVAAPSARVADAHHEWGLWLALLAAALIAFDVYWMTRKRREVSLESIAARRGAT
jgi:Aerotolerance regulator N-terminal/von Willebrand factor type A domain